MRRHAFCGMRKMYYIENGQIFSVNVWEEFFFSFYFLVSGDIFYLFHSFCSVSLLGVPL